MEKLRADDPEFFGNFKAVARIGSGGFGTVFLCERGTQRAAIKVINYDQSEEFSAQEDRFVREVSNLQKVNSPYIPRLLEFSVDESPIWFATEYIDGWTLQDIVANQGPLTLNDWAYVLECLLDAVDDLHGAGLIHRDVKPQNVVLGQLRIALIDLGIAKDTAQETVFGSLVGTTNYMSPEQVSGQELSAKSDYFALGATMYFAATAQPIWGRGTLQETQARILVAPVEYPDGVPPIIARIIDGLTAKQPEERLTYSGVKRILEEVSESARSSDLVTRVTNLIESKTVRTVPETLLMRGSRSNNSGPVEHLRQQSSIQGQKKLNPVLSGAIALGLLITGGFLGARAIGLGQEAKLSSPTQSPTPVVTVTEVKTQTPETVVVTETAASQDFPQTDQNSETDYASWTYFMSPKQNIFCEFNIDYEDIRCDFITYNGKVPSSFKQDCPSWRNTSFAIDGSGEGHWNCVTNSIVNKQWHVLPYNQPVSHFGVTCELNTKELYCYNDAGYELHANRNRATFN